MVQRTILKVRFSCDKCKKKIMKSVSGLQGVDKIEIDAAKETLTVTGDADPYVIIKKVRKVIKCVDVVTIGPPPAPPKNPEVKKPPEKKPEVNIQPYIHMPPPSCVAYGQWPYVVHMTEQPCPPCFFM